MLNTLEAISPITHWLYTPIGSYCGFPTYGFNWETLLYKNSHDAFVAVEKISKKMKEDLGDEIFRQIKDISIVTSGDEYFLLIEAYNGYKTGVQLWYLWQEKR